MAFFGAIKCFKYAILNEAFSLKKAQNYAVAGGNIEIIYLLEEKNISFSYCLEVSVKFHRHCIRILLHYEYEESSLYCSLNYLNYRAFFFEILNGVSDAMISASVNSYLDNAKYLVDKCIDIIVNK